MTALDPTTIPGFTGHCDGWIGHCEKPPITAWFETVTLVGEVEPIRIVALLCAECYLDGPPQMQDVRWHRAGDAAGT